MNYKKTCTKCGKPSHSKQILYERTVWKQTKSGLVQLPIPCIIRLCAACCHDAIDYLSDRLTGFEYPTFINVYGQELPTDTSAKQQLNKNTYSNNKIICRKSS